MVARIQNIDVSKASNDYRVNIMMARLIDESVSNVIGDIQREMQLVVGDKS